MSVQTRWIHESVRWWTILCWKNLPLILHRLCLRVSKLSPRITTIIIATALIITRARTIIVIIQDKVWESTEEEEEEEESARPSQKFSRATTGLWYQLLPSKSLFPSFGNMPSHGCCTKMLYALRFTWVRPTQVGKYDRADDRPKLAMLTANVGYRYWTDDRSRLGW